MWISKALLGETHQANVRQAIGVPYEYILVDNTANPRGICSAYTRGADAAPGNILTFVHATDRGMGRYFLQSIAMSCQYSLPSIRFPEGVPSAR
jgi:hypothetical protein